MRTSFPQMADTVPGHCYSCGIFMLGTSDQEQKNFYTDLCVDFLKPIYFPSLSILYSVNLVIGICLHTNIGNEEIL